MILILILLFSMTTIAVLLDIWIKSLTNQINQENMENINLQNQKRRKDELSFHEEYRQSAIEKDGKIDVDLVLNEQFADYLSLKTAIGWHPTEDQERAINKISPLSNVSNTPLINL